MQQRRAAGLFAAVMFTFGVQTRSTAHLGAAAVADADNVCGMHACRPCHLALLHHPRGVVRGMDTAQ